MQLFFLIIVNIFMGALLYLIISLKLERSATEFRSKRLKKEMDQIIKEFNVTAERNITILENRISVLQRLLVRSGQIKSIDISIGDTVNYGDPEKDIEPVIPAEAALPAAGDIHESFQENSSIVRDGNALRDFSKKIVERVRNGMNSILDVMEKKNPRGERDSADYALAEDEFGRSISAATHIPDAHDTYTVRGGETVDIDEEEIAGILASSASKYAAISALHEKGCSPETISKYSGIPVGEISLVLNLHNSRTQ